MGGIGSGRRYRPGEVKATVDSFPSLSISQIMKRGLFEPGTIFTNTYSIGTKQLGHAMIIVCQKEIFISSHIKNSKHTQVVKINRTPCTFGGSRPWFLCPVCKKQRVFIYYKDRRWACRVCSNLCYRVQQLNARKRHRYMVEQIQSKKLGGTASGGLALKRPFRMRVDTYIKILNELSWHQRQSFKHLAAWFQRLKESTDKKVDRN